MPVPMEESAEKAAVAKSSKPKIKAKPPSKADGDSPTKSAAPSAGTETKGNHGAESEPSKQAGSKRRKMEVGTSNFERL